MMLGRIARSLATPAFRGMGQKAPVAIARRNASSIPTPLSVRMDSLFVQCTISALIHFVPQDVIFLGGVLYMWHASSSAKSPKKKNADMDAAVEAFKAKKGLDSVKYSRGYVSI